MAKPSHYTRTSSRRSPPTTHGNDRIRSEFRVQWRWIMSPQEISSFDAGLLKITSVVSRYGEPASSESAKDLGGGSFDNGVGRAAFSALA